MTHSGKFWCGEAFAKELPVPKGKPSDARTRKRVKSIWKKVESKKVVS